MDEAAPQAAGGTGTEDISKALDVLLLLWDDEYLIGHDDEHGWWASRRGVVGHILTARTAPKNWARCWATISGRGDERLPLHPQGFRLARGRARQGHVAHRGRRAWPTCCAAPDPITADCANCAVPIRLENRLQYRWRHVPAGGAG